MRWPSASLLCSVLSIAAACKPRAPTYHRDVAPILARHCADCHRQGGVAPVPQLDSYESARHYAQPIRMAVQNRRMPPWGADHTGLCGTWQHARWLSSEEITTLARWHESGAAQGEAPRSPLPPVVPAAAAFRADATLDIGGEYHPRLGARGSRCFVTDPQLAQARLLTALRLVAKDARAIAQVTLFALDTDAAGAAALALDAGDPGLGYACYGGPRVDGARTVASWTWPTPVLRLPAGTGVRLDAGKLVVVQIHYNITHTGDAFASDTQIELELGARGPSLVEARVVPIRTTGTLPPAQRYAAVEDRVAIPARQRVIGIIPRMHIRGETLQLTIERGATSTCLATFDHWNPFNEQLFVRTTPAVLEAGDRLRIQCAYGTLGREKPVKFGETIDEEECAATLLVTD